MDGYAVRAADVAEAADSRPVRLDGRRRVARGQRPGRPGAARDGRADRDRRAGAAGRRCRRPRGADDAARRVRHPGSARPRGGRPAPRRVSRARGGRAGQRDPRARQRRARGRRRSPPPATSSRPRSSRWSPGPGVPMVSVRRRPIVAVLATGDEVRSPDMELGPAGIPDANGPGLRALVRDAGAVPLDLGHRRRTASRTSRRASGAASPRRTSSSCRAASRSGRTTSSGSRSTRSAT